MERNRTHLTVCAVLILLTAVICAALLTVMQGITTFSFDDYYYARFWSQGPIQFLKWNVEHFFSRNGRVMVHVLAETLLALGGWVYALWGTAMLAGILALFLSWQARGKLPLSTCAVAACAFFAGILLVNYRVLKSWMLCVADSCNYIFPLLMIGILLRSLEWKGGKPLSRGVLACLCGFLAGATTEQGGAKAVPGKEVFRYLAVTA